MAIVSMVDMRFFVVPTLILGILAIYFGKAILSEIVDITALALELIINHARYFFPIVTAIFFASLYFSLKNYSIKEFCKITRTYLLSFLFISICSPFSLLFYVAIHNMIGSIFGIISHSKLSEDFHIFSISLYLISSLSLFFFGLFIQFSLFNYIRQINVDYFFTLKCGALEKMLSCIGAFNLYILMQYSLGVSTLIYAMFLGPIMIISCIALCIKFILDTIHLLTKETNSSI